MPTETVIYKSANGDQRYLLQEADLKRMLVRHQPNRASGGQAWAHGGDGHGWPRIDRLEADPLDGADDDFSVSLGEMRVGIDQFSGEF
jgi:hypothetical protein